MSHLEIKKMKQGMSYSCKEKTIILNVFKYFRLQCPDKCITEIVRRTAKATGCSEKSIFQFRKEEASVEGFREPSKTKVRKNININSRDIKYDENVRQAIRNIIYDLRCRNVVPSLSTILKRVHADDGIPNFSLMTLRRLMFDMGFYYEKEGNKSILAEKPIINEDNVPQKPQPKVHTNKHVLSNNQHNSVPVVGVSNEHMNKPGPPKYQNTINIPPPNRVHHNMSHPQDPRVMSMDMQTHESHMMGPMHAPAVRNMPMMLNVRHDMMYPPHEMEPPNIDLHLKRDIRPPWVHYHNVIKH